MPVYIVQSGDDGPVKIGRSRHIERRMRSLQSGHHERLRLLRTLHGDSRTEAWLHGMFAAQRLVGEWFTFSADMLSVDPPTFDRGVSPSVRADGHSALSEYLATNHIRLHEFAATVGLSTASVSKLANGINKPTLDTMQKIAKATAGVVSANDFLRQHHPDTTIMNGESQCPSTDNPTPLPPSHSPASGSSRR